MQKITIYTRPDLDALVAGAVGTADRSAWLASMLAKVAGIIKGRPKAYLTFGPYWWAVKAQLVAAGLMSGEVNAELAAAVTTGDDALDLAGAVAYHGYNVDQMRDSNLFTVDTEDGDQVEYVLDDPQMEARMAMA